MINYEYKRIVDCPIYFMEKYVLPTPHRLYKSEPELNSLQEELLYDIQYDSLRRFGRYNGVFRSDLPRRSGITTLLLGYLMWLIISNSDKNMLLISPKIESNTYCIHNIIIPTLEKVSHAINIEGILPRSSLTGFVHFNNGCHLWSTNDKHQYKNLMLDHIIADGIFCNEADILDVFSYGRAGTGREIISLSQIK